MNTTIFEVYAEWIADQGIWIAISEDVPGLCVQANSFDEMTEIVTTLVPELLELNNKQIPLTIPLNITAKKLLI